MKSVLLFNFEAFNFVWVFFLILTIFIFIDFLILNNFNFVCFNFEGLGG